MSNHLSNELILDYLHGELPPEDDALVHSHLDECASCRREYETEASLREALRVAAAREELEFPSQIAAEIWQAVREARPSPLARFLAAFRPVTAIPVAAALALGIYFATSYGHGGPSAPKIAATYYLEVHAAQEAQNPLAERGPAGVSAIETSALDAGNSTELADNADLAVAAPAAINVVQ